MFREYTSGDKTVVSGVFQNKRAKSTAIFISIVLPCMLVGYGVFMNIRPALTPGGKRSFAEVLIANSDLILAVLFLAVTAVPFFLVFDKKQAQARDLVPIALMSAMGIAGRVAFAAIPLPNFKPVTAIVIITGVAFGPEAGYLTGALTAFLSNFLFGQGPWTPWQMFCWALIGFVAGLGARIGLFGELGKRIKGKEMRSIRLCVFGFLAAMMYGMIMDIFYVIGYVDPLTPGNILLAYLAGVPTDVSHGVCTALVLAVVGNSWIRRLIRIKTKFGLAGEERRYEMPPEI